MFALAALPTGRWFGVDGILYGLWYRFRPNRRRPAVVEESVPRPAVARETAAGDVPAVRAPAQATARGKT